ncbi:MAG: alginate lyase family protein [Bacteroidaceae bacterium]|nr:alginate lyase family protein [Bacteroidaceae bacterium]
MAQERGFVHPGGLHTQADFDRVKAQLAGGNVVVKQAYAKLKGAAYAQPSVQTYPTETIVRGGGSGENYMNAARGAAMAYQNAMRWKIEDNTACAKTAVRILMEWAKTTKAIGGDTNYALAAGLYGYAFAQAAELVRDYEGWSRDDFEEFRQWMLTVWYPSSLGFLRGRCGTWENGDKWWQAPGHYWSNWGLCNALCVVSIGVLCDDVFIYNQGMSYFKYDQVGNFNVPTTLYEVTGHDEAYNGTQCIHNDGLTEFLGNFVVTTSRMTNDKLRMTNGEEVEVGGYGELGQLNESGRDAGHSSMSLGLAVDLAKIGWNQGDDLFAYMDHRLAAGIEFLAAQTQSVENLPWTNYMYGTNGIYYSDARAWLMTEPVLGAQIRPYWGTIIGIYEGVKGVKMPFSELAYNQMGIDEGAQGSTSGGYDHMGYSVLMNTRDEQLCPADKVPTELKPMMEYSGTVTSNLIPSLINEKKRGLVDGKTIYHNELGGLVNTYNTNNNTCPPAGQTVTLMPQLPDGEEDTGNWQWNTGETTRNITVTTDSSYIYRVTYTNENGVESQLTFSIAAKGDCTPDGLTPNITYEGETSETDTIDVLYGKTVTLSVTSTSQYGTYKWSSGATTQAITTTAIRKDQDITVTYTNQGGATTTQVFHLHVITAIPYCIIGDTTTEDSEVVVEHGGNVTFGLTTPASVAASKVVWRQRINTEFLECATGSKTLTLENVQQSGEYTATFPLAGEDHTFSFLVFVPAQNAASIPTGNYLIEDVRSGCLLTGHGKNQLVSFEDREENLDGQCWFVSSNDSRYALVNLPDSLGLSTAAKLLGTQLYSFSFDAAVGSDRVGIHTGSSASTTKYWTVNADGSLLTTNTELTTFPFRLILVSGDGIGQVSGDEHESVQYYSIDGVRRTHLQRGVNIVRKTLKNGEVFVARILYK